MESELTELFIYGKNQPTCPECGKEDSIFGMIDLTCFHCEFYRKYDQVIRVYMEKGRDGKFYETERRFPDGKIEYSDLMSTHMGENK